MKIPRVNAKTWYSAHISFEMPILQTYVDGIERQIQDSKKDYASRAKVVKEIEVPEENLYEVVTMIDGLDDTTYSYEAIFDDYFPQLQRRSSLITLYSFFEFEFKSLCKMYDVAFEPKGVRGAPPRSSELAKCFHFLTTTGGLNISLTEPTWLEIDNCVRIVRNRFIHNDAKIPDLGDIHRQNFDQHLIDYPDLVQTKGETINVEKGYIEHVLGVYDELCKIVDAAINPRQKV